MTKTGKLYNRDLRQIAPYIQNIPMAEGNDDGSALGSLQAFKMPLPSPEVIDFTDKEHTEKNFKQAGHELECLSRETIAIKCGLATLYDYGGVSVKVPIWGYRGQYLGPTIVVAENQSVEINWINDVCPTMRQPSVAIAVKFCDAGAVAEDQMNVDQDQKNKKNCHERIPTDDNNPTDCMKTRICCTEADTIIPQNVIGQVDIPYDCEVSYTMGSHSRAYFTTHLHGAKIAPSYDGGPEDLISYGQSHLDRYENNQRATMLWYHDHAMHTTRLNVFSGLAGLWFIRGKEERELNLPSGAYEIPLVIQDRNITEVSDEAQFLHKVETHAGPLEFFGPLTLVNGVIWPFKEVENGWYRLRILNGSNSRTYRLVFACKKGETWEVCKLPVYQIGSDGGLMGSAVNLTARDDNLIPNAQNTAASMAGLTISPAERVDLLVDFSRLEDGQEICVLNSAEAPFGNALAPDSIAELFHEQHPEQDIRRTPYPHVMSFKVKHNPACETHSFDMDFVKAGLSKEGTSYQHNLPVQSEKEKVRTVAVVEKTTDKGAVLVLWELLPEAEVPEETEATEIKEANKPILVTRRKVVIDGDSFVAVAERYYDPISFIIPEGTTERWRFVNLTADTHPMHLHLVQYLPIARWHIQCVNSKPILREPTKKEPDPGSVGDQILKSTEDTIRAGDPLTVTTEAPPPNGSNGVDGAEKLDDNEKCFKDTVRVNPGEMVEIRAKFEGYHGRFVYHCHLLEHEDHDMMRQFIVTRNDLNMGHMGLPISVGRLKDIRIS